MTRLHQLCSESRYSPRLTLPRGLLDASLPPPVVWNWFNDCAKVSVLNLSQLGLGIEASRPLQGNLQLRVKTPLCCYLLEGKICHQQITGLGYYFGVNCFDCKEQLEELVAEATAQQRRLT